jgi:hypothetical protein
MKAGPIRLRPILMTTFAVIFGMLPVALYGSESRSPMAVAVIGGLTTSTLLTLVVAPVVYTLLDDLTHPSRWRAVQRVRQRRGMSVPATNDSSFDPSSHPPAVSRQCGAGLQWSPL